MMEERGGSEKDQSEWQKKNDENMEPSVTVLTSYTFKLWDAFDF